MPAEKNSVVDQAVSSIWYLSEDKKIRDEIWKKEDNELIQKSIDEYLAKYEQLKKDNEKLMLESKEKDAEILMLKKELEELKK